jgi:Flp pilus assembly pilin Flp
MGDPSGPHRERKEVKKRMLLSLYSRLQTAWAGVRSRFEDETGAVATEYVFLLVLIALAITGGMIFLASAINAKFSDAGSGVSGT